MKIAIIDLLGLCYDGNTLKHRGLGGSESAVILISKELAKLGHQVTVLNNCIDSQASPGIYDDVEYIDHTTSVNNIIYDIVISSRSVKPFFANNQYGWITANAKKKILWMHDTFCEGDEFLEAMVMQGYIDEVFTLSDFHSWYVTSCDHGNRRNFEVLKHKFFQTRNGAVTHINEVDLSKKDPNHFVYNASATKGLIPLVTKIWPEIKKAIPEARLTCIGGFYRFREGAEPDEQEKMVNELVASNPPGVRFTGVIPQYEIAEILSNSTLMLYPTAFPETFGISSLESLLYKTPIVTNTFGALEETAIEKACYKIPYSSTNNALFRNINEDEQAKIFVQTVLNAHSNRYLLQQKQNYCDVVRDVSGWDTVALQWDQHFHRLMEMPYDVSKYRSVKRINQKVARVFGRRFSNPEDREVYTSHGKQRRIVIVSPFWNAEEFIERHIRSVAQQDYVNYVHVLIDDASDDRGFWKALDIVSTLPLEIRGNFFVYRNDENVGCIHNQLKHILLHSNDEDIVMLLDGDDYLTNNPTIFHYYNDLYSQGYEFTYGSMWSMVDNIPLIAQEYPQEVKENKTYREHMFNWKIPYTHLRTCVSKYFKTINEEIFKVNGEWMKSGADNPLFYELIEQIHPDKIYCNREIICYYNDASPYNDYKIKGEEQNRNANMSYKKQNKFSVIVPTMWKSNKLFGESLQRLVNNDLVDEIIIINNDVEKTPILKILSHKKIKLLDQKENIKVNPAWNLGVKESKNDLVAIINDDLCFDTKLFYKIADHIHEDVGVYGFMVGGEKYNQPELTDGSIDLIKWDPSVCAYGFGQLMVMNKKNWTPIIDDLEVYFGDDFIMHNIHQSGKDIYLIANMEYEEDFGCTTRELGIWQECYDKEKPIFDNWLNPKKEVKEVKTILIAVPTNKYIEPETFKSIYDQEVPEGYKTEFQFFYGYQIDQIRNLIAEWAKGYDYLFSVDSDIILPQGSLRKMIEADKDMVSGMYIQRIPDTHTLEIYMVDQNGSTVNIPKDFIAPFNGLVEIAGCGFGCVLIKSEVFRKMEYPHFYYKSALNHNDTVSEDIYFCMKARDLGFKIWVDTTIKCDHKGSTLYRVKLEEPKKEIKLELKTEKDGGVTVIPDVHRNEKVFR